jgi:hypothetical protein
VRGFCVSRRVVHRVSFCLISQLTSAVRHCSTLCNRGKRLPRKTILRTCDINQDAVTGVHSSRNALLHRATHAVERQEHTEACTTIISTAVLLLQLQKLEHKSRYNSGSVAWAQTRSPD